MSDLAKREKLLDEFLQYGSLSDFKSWFSANLISILTDDNPNGKGVDNERILLALVSAEGVVNGKLKRTYNVPIPRDNIQEFSIVKLIVFYIAIYNLYGRRGITQEAQANYDTYTELLDQIADGTIEFEGKKTHDGITGQTWENEFLNSSI